MSPETEPNPKVEIEFPTNYCFKVIVDPARVSQTQLIQIVTSLIPRPNQIANLLEKESKNKKYISHSLVVHLMSRQEMETLYTAFKKMDGVVYLL